MGRIRLRKKKKRKNIFFFCIVLSIILSVLVVHLIDKKVTPILLRYAKSETRRFSTIVINNAVDDEVIDKLNNEDIFMVTKNNSDEIQMIDFDTKKVNGVLEFINKKITNDLRGLEDGNIKDLDVVDTFKGVNFKNLKKGIVCEVPVGIVFSNSLLSNMGPVIPVKLSFIGDVMTKLKTNVKNYGINNVYVEVNVHVEVVQKITMPISTSEVLVSLDIPLTAKMIQGKVPTYFAGSSGKENLFSLPNEE